MKRFFIIVGVIYAICLALSVGIYFFGPRNEGILSAQWIFAAYYLIWIPTILFCATNIIAIIFYWFRSKQKNLITVVFSVVILIFLVFVMMNVLLLKGWTILMFGALYNNLYSR